MDVRFTPHYMRTAITYNKMTSQQANEYLSSQEYLYRTSVSHGNMSNKRRKSIETTFALLYAEYRLPESADEKYLAVISSLSEVKSISSVGFSDVKKSMVENKIITQKSASTLSTLITKQDKVISGQNEKISNQLTDIQQSSKNNIETNERVLESVNFLSEQSSIIKDGITNVNQSVSETYSAVNRSIDKISELSSQQADGISNTQKHLNHISSNVELVKSTVEPIALYTEQKQQEDLVEEKRIDELRESQEKRETTAYNREKGKKLTSFESALSEKQIKILTSYCNQIPVFDRDIELQEMKDILLCTHQKPLKLTVNRYLSALFSELYDEDLICKTWKSVASRHKCFISAKGKGLTVNDLYMANQTSVFMDERKSDLIKECINKISSASN